MRCARFGKARSLRNSPATKAWGQTLLTRSPDAGESFFASKLVKHQMALLSRRKNVHFENAFFGTSKNGKQIAKKKEAPSREPLEESFA